MTRKKKPPPSSRIVNLQVWLARFVRKNLGVTDATGRFNYFLGITGISAISFFGPVLASIELSDQLNAGFTLDPIPTCI